MLRFEGKVVEISDEVRALPVKDAMGVNTGRTLDHRITNICIQVADPHKKGRMRDMVVKFFDLPSTAKLPAEGENYVTPEVKSYEFNGGQPTCSC